MPLITMNVPERLGNSLLETLTRIAVALERIAGPVIEYRAPTPATLDDYRVVTPETADQLRLAKEDFASRHMVVPGSPAYLAAVSEFERQVAEAYGLDAVDKLPWRDVPRSVQISNVDSTPVSE